ncbi:hypothetical protein HDU67_003248 [Dinochytrium kinnereticum]|nr:hypothetical protein HDU67_003248 [Dinochytrium kinnereticum]
MQNPPSDDGVPAAGRTLQLAAEEEPGPRATGVSSTAISLIRDQQQPMLHHLHLQQLLRAQRPRALSAGCNYHCTDRLQQPPLQTTPNHPSPSAMSLVTDRDSQLQQPLLNIPTTDDIPHLSSPHNRANESLVAAQSSSHRPPKNRSYSAGAADVIINPKPHLGHALPLFVSAPLSTAMLCSPDADHCSGLDSTTPSDVKDDCVNIPSSISANDQQLQEDLKAFSDALIIPEKIPSISYSSHFPEPLLPAPLIEMDSYSASPSPPCVPQDRQSRRSLSSISDASTTTSLHGPTSLAPSSATLDGSSAHPIGGSGLQARPASVELEISSSNVSDQGSSLNQWQPIVARSIKSFAVYLGDLTTLMKTITTNDSRTTVDLLVIAADQVALLQKDEAKEINERVVSAPANDAQELQGGLPSDHLIRELYGIEGDRQQAARKSSETQPPTTPEEKRLLNERLRQNFKHIVVAVNVAEVYAMYNASANKIGSSFSKTFVAWVLATVVETARFPVSGLVLIGLCEAARLHPAGDGFVAKIVMALRANKEFSEPGGKQGLRSIYLDEHDRRNSHLRIDRVEFDDVVNRLKIEITLREDFMVFGIEPVYGCEDRLDAAVTRHAISWYRGLGFLFWFCRHLPEDSDEPPKQSASWDCFGRDVSDVKPPRLTSLSEDSIFELAVHPSVKTLKSAVESSYSKIRRLQSASIGSAVTSTSIPILLPITPVVWSRLLQMPMPDPAVEFFSGMKAVLEAANEGHFDDVIYERVEPFHPGRRSDVPAFSMASDSPATPSPSSSSYMRNMAEILRDLPVSLAGNLSRMFDSETWCPKDLSPISAKTVAFPKHPFQSIAADTSGPSSSMGYLPSASIVFGIASHSSEARRQRLSDRLRRNLSDLSSKKLLASLKTNVDVESSSPSPKFVECVQILESFINKPTATALWLCEIVSRASLGAVSGYKEVRAIFRDLLEGLNNGTVVVWLASKAAFLSAEAGPTTEGAGASRGGAKVRPLETVWCFAEIVDDSIHIYVSENSPNVAEIVLHAFAKLVVSAQGCEADDDTFPLPSRISVEVEDQTHTGRLRLIRNSSLVLGRIRSSEDLTPGEVSYLIHLTHCVSKLSEKILIDRQAYEDLKLYWAKDAYMPQNDLEITLYSMVGQCTFDMAGARRFVAVMETLRGWLMNFPPSSAEIHATCLLFMSIQKAIRRCAYMNLQVSLLNKNALFIPDSDQVAVGLEMSTTPENIRSVFELTPLQLAAPMHAVLRDMAFKASSSPAPASRKMGSGEDGEEEDSHQSLKAEGYLMEKKIANAYLFVYPILIDLVLVRLVGSGIFYSDRMNVSARYSITLIFLIMYPIIGGVMNSIGRTVTYYFYQKSIPLMIAAFIRRLAAGIIVAMFGSITVAAIEFYLNKDYVTALLTFLYSIAFSLYMVLLCGLVSFRDPDDFFVLSPGPRVVFMTIPIMSVSAFISRFYFMDSASSTIVWAIYTCILLITVAFMAWSYRQIAISYLKWPETVDVTTKTSIIDLYVKEASAEPVQENGENIEVFERRRRRWERSATEWWMERVEKAMKSKSILSSSEPPVIIKRAAQRRWENMLMKWYFERSGLAVPPQRYSNEWDIALQQALTELKKKYNVEKLNRGDILFDFESPAIVFGFLYFITIFVDKWCLLLVTGQATLFIPNNAISQAYVAGVLYGTVFLLIASGMLELTLSFMYEKQKESFQQPLSHAKSMEKMVESHWNSISKIYKGELTRFLGFSLIIFVLVTIPVLVFNRDLTTLVVYVATSVGYLGLLIGLFHKLFITSDERFLNRVMLIGLVVSVVTMCVVLHTTKDMRWASGTITLNGLVFGLSCLATYSRESLATAHYRITVSSTAPALTSSGQRMIGYEHKYANQERLNELGKRLLGSQGRFTILLPTSELGRRVAKRIQSSLKRVAKLPKDHLLNVAFPTAGALADSIASRFYDRLLVVHLVPANIEIGGIQYHAISASEGGCLHIFFDGPDTDVGWSDDDLVILCECIVHECAEELGMSHSDACAIEALMSHQDDMSMEVDFLSRWVPNRVQRFLAGIGAATHTMLVNATEDVVEEKACLSIDFDRFWGRDGGVSHEDRCSLLALTRDWWFMFEDCLQNFSLPEHIDFGECDSVMNIREGSDLITMRMILARSLISALLAENVKSACQKILLAGLSNRFQPNRRPIRKKNRLVQFIDTINWSSNNENAEITVDDLISGTIGKKKHMMLGANHTVESGAFSKFIGICIDAVVAFFLALTADVRFGRELAVTPWPVRWPLALLNLVSRKLVVWLTQSLIYYKIPSIAQILKRNEAGVFRIMTKTYDARTRKVEISRVDVFASASQTVVSAVGSQNSSNETSVNILDPECDLTLIRFTGPKPIIWQPGANEKPTSRGFFNQVTSRSPLKRNSYRLVQENFYDTSGSKIIKKHTYEYHHHQSRFPTRRKVHLIEYNGQQSISFLSETHVFSRIARHSVESAHIRRIHKPTNKSILIFAEYPDANVEGPQRFFYKSNYPQEWTLIFKTTGSFSTDSPPIYAFAEFHRKDENGFYRTIFDYSHPQHPTMASVYVKRTSSGRRDLPAHNDMNLPLAMAADPGEPVPTPAEILEDHFGVLTLRPPTAFHLSSELADSGFRTRTSRKWSLVPPFVRSVQVEFLLGPCSTVRKREDLWTAWRDGKIPGVFAREIDERFLRDEPLLITYWRCRDLGKISAARASLSNQKQLLDVCLKVPDRPATRTHLKIRFSDLFMLGVGGDAHQVFSFDHHANEFDDDDGKKSEGWGLALRRTAVGQNLPFTSAQVQMQKDDGTRLNVMNVDSGTWPTGGGGVGSCRRDLIDGISRIRWNAIAEIGSAQAVQKDYQIERNIDSIIYVVLWDVDFGTPNENVYRIENQRKLRRKQRATTDRVVRDLFVPLVDKLVEGCFRQEIPSSGIEEYEDVFVGLYHFFQLYDWTTAWNHACTQEAWIKGWLKGGAKLWKKGVLHDFESPTLQQIDILFGLITRLLLPLTVKVPELPVIHASHHGIQAMIGVISKKIHGSGFVVWDHGILWRERLFGLCSDAMPRFTQCGFAGISRLVARIVFARADYITPCTSIQNVAWEAWIGGGKHGSELDNVMIIKKINPVLNGMDLSKFSVKRQLETDLPSAVMLSHISPVKDIMNAIGAASYIVNEFKLSSYRLNIYGSPEKEPSYTAECLAAIVNMNLGNNVTLRGLGSPSAVLPTGWVFVNSSITEGLPLALGEAGLTGLPVTCTDVGGSREVVSNLATGEVYGAIVPPSKPRQLALGQLKILAMTDGLSRVADPETDIQDITLEELIALGPDHLERRIMDERIMDLRRKLGMRLRERTISVFSMARYLREHEQILWCASYKSKSARAPV